MKQIFTLFLGAGILYLIGWFLSNEANIMLWPAYGKFFYLLIVFFGYVHSD